MQSVKTQENINLIIYLISSLPFICFSLVKKYPLLLCLKGNIYVNRICNKEYCFCFIKEVHDVITYSRIYHIKQVTLMFFFYVENSSQSWYCPGTYKTTHVNHYNYSLNARI
jgi:hypothetical protein